MHEFKAGGHSRLKAVGHEVNRSVWQSQKKSLKVNDKRGRRGSVLQRRRGAPTVSGVRVHSRTVCGGTSLAHVEATRRGACSGSCLAPPGSANWRAPTTPTTLLRKGSLSLFFGGGRWPQWATARKSSCYACAVRLLRHVASSETPWCCLRRKPTVVGVADIPLFDFFRLIFVLCHIASHWPLAIKACCSLILQAIAFDPRLFGNVCFADTDWDGSSFAWYDLSTGTCAHVNTAATIRALAFVLNW